MNEFEFYFSCFSTFAEDDDEGGDKKKRLEQLRDEFRERLKDQGFKNGSPIEWLFLGFIAGMEKANDLFEKLSAFKK